MNGQYGPEAMIDTLGDALIGATVTVPAGYSGVLDSLGNLTITGPAADAVTYTITPVGKTPISRTVVVPPLPSQMAALIETVNTVASSGAAQTLPDVTVATVHRVTLTANCTFTFPSPVAGKSFTLTLVQDATGSRTVTWPGAVAWSGGTAPTLTTTATKRDVFSFMCDDGVSWTAFTAGLNY